MRERGGQEGLENEAQVRADMQARAGTSALTHLFHKGAFSALVDQATREDV